MPGLPEGLRDGAFEARYFGDCAACGDKIVPGDLVLYDGDDLVHEECA